MEGPRIQGVIILSECPLWRAVVQNVPLGGQEISPAIKPGFFLALRSLVQWQFSHYGFVKPVNVARTGPGDNSKPQNLVSANSQTAPSGVWPDRAGVCRTPGNVARPAPQTAPNDFHDGLSRRAERGMPCLGTTSLPRIATAKGVSDQKPLQSGLPRRKCSTTPMSDVRALVKGGRAVHGVLSIDAGN